VTGVSSNNGDANGEMVDMQRAVFLDRDGTLGGDGGYCHPDDFRLFGNVPSAIRLLNEAGYVVIVVTNQTHIGHGEITVQQMDASFRRLQTELAAAGAHLDGWYICPHRKADACSCRKPSPSLLQQAAREHHLDLAASWTIGDAGAADILAGAAAGCRTILVRNGWGENSLGAYRHTWAAVEPDYVADDLLDAAQRICAQTA
jgi:histidinol-phosphate phosphatase family protein